MPGRAEPARRTEVRCQGRTKNRFFWGFWHGVRRGKRVAGGRQISIVQIEANIRYLTKLNAVFNVLN